MGEDCCKFKEQTINYLFLTQAGVCFEMRVSLSVIVIRKVTN